MTHSHRFDRVHKGSGVMTIGELIGFTKEAAQLGFDASTPVFGELFDINAGVRRLWVEAPLDEAQRARTIAETLIQDLTDLDQDTADD